MFQFAFSFLFFLIFSIFCLNRWDFSYIKKKKNFVNIMPLNPEKIPLKKITKSRITKLGLALSTITIILISFFVSNPTPDFEFHITGFSIESEKVHFRTGYPITFSFEFMGNPSQVTIIWGDGALETIETEHLYEENGVIFGSINHSYSIQGRYSPKFQIWDYKGKEYSKSLELTIQNDILQFNINLSCDNQTFEDQEVLLSIQDIFELNEGLKQSIENLTYLYDFSESQITSKECSIEYTWKNSGRYPITVSIIDGQGTISRRTTYIEVLNRAPSAFFEILSSTSLHAQSNIQFNARKNNDTVSDKHSLQYIWNWGDNTASWGKWVSHTYSQAGFYNVTLTVMDNDAATDIYSRVIWVNDALIEHTPTSSSSSENHDPYIAIGTFPNEVYEDELFQFTSIVELQDVNVTDYQFNWDFGDGVISYERAPKHAWITAGIYDITLKVSDYNGNEYLRYGNIVIKEKAPEILGPFSFQGVEGQAINLDVEVYDALLDRPNLNYYWYKEKNELFSTNNSPTVFLDDGKYTYTLNVTDPSGLTSSREINIIVHSRSPEIFVPNYMYYGPPGNPFSTDDTGELVLRAFGYDCLYDISELEFRWLIKNGKDKTFLFDRIFNNYSEVTFKCEETTIYQGQVEIIDPSGTTKIATFEIFSNIEDSDNEYKYNKYSSLEKLYGLELSQSQESTTDSDGDNLSDYYENEISMTNYLDPDTDGDGLVDGYDDSGIGELTLGTSPREPDSDFDNLNDYLEYYGWDISINYFENTSLIHVNSDPLDKNTDNDYVSDYEEFIAKSHPRLRDSDADG